MPGVSALRRSVLAGGSCRVAWPPPARRCRTGSRAFARGFWWAREPALISFGGMRVVATVLRMTGADLHRGRDVEPLAAEWRARQDDMRFGRCGEDGSRDSEDRRRGSRPNRELASLAERTSNSLPRSQPGRPAPHGRGMRCALRMTPRVIRKQDQPACSPEIAAGLL
jgi:hypothetical protein